MLEDPGDGETKGGSQNQQGVVHQAVTIQQLFGIALGEAFQVPEQPPRIIPGP